MSYGWLFESPDDDISGDDHINLEHLPICLTKTVFAFMALMSEKNPSIPTEAVPAVIVSRSLQNE